MRKNNDQTAAVTVARPATSPSNLHRRELCPRSAFMETGLPDIDSDFARGGRLIHQYWGNPQLDRAFLSDDERDLLELTDRLMSDVLARLALDTPQVYFEKTMSTPRITGTPDRIYIWPSHKIALVADLKSGFAIVERAELNLQLRAYAVNVADLYLPDLVLEHVFVAILQPRLWLPSERISLAHYEQPHLESARRQIDRINAATEDPDAPLRSGEDQCRFCRAKLTCPAFRDAMALPLVAFKTEEELSKTKREAEIAERIKQCSDEQLERVITACKLAGMIKYPAHDEARMRIRAGMYTNFVLGKEGEVRTITNIRRAIPLLILGDVATREEILNICDIPIKPLEEAYRKRVGGTWQEAKDKINKVLASVIAREPRAPTILPKK
jgi:Protein of unknown function (DUF2800)